MYENLSMSVSVNSLLLASQINMVAIIWGLENFSFIALFEKCGVEISFGEQECNILKTK